jgi:hypothetical protein
MKELCRALDVRFDRHFTERWSSYTFVTGDVSGSRGGTQIKAVPQRAVDPGLLDQIAANPDYRASLELLGYDHPFGDRTAPRD